MPQRFEATWNFKLAAVLLGVPLLMLGAVVGTDSTVPYLWRGLYVVGAAMGLAGCWRWSRSHCVIDREGLTVVGIVRRRRFAAAELTGAEVDVLGVPSFALRNGRSVKLGFLSALFGPQRQRAADFAVAVGALVKAPT